MLNTPVRAGSAWCRATVALIGATAMPLAAQQSKPCTMICAPTIALNVAENTSHVFGSPSVRNDTTGVVSKLPSRHNLQLQLFVSAKTQLQHLYVFVASTWLPTAKTRANPYTEYTASEVGEDIRANHVNVTLGALADIIPASSTRKYFALQGYVADLLSPAARPRDASTYTHKLDLGGVALLYPFAGTDSTSALHKSGFYLYGNLDYVATGLPKKGDDVPKGVRTFLTGAKPAVFILGVGLPVAPLLQSK